MNLKFWTKPTILTDKEGEKTELIEVADCNCMFLLTYHLESLPLESFNIVYVNGQTLEQIDADNILTEVDLDIELDSLKK